MIIDHLQFDDTIHILEQNLRMQEKINELVKAYNNLSQRHKGLLKQIQRIEEKIEKGD